MLAGHDRRGVEVTRSPASMKVAVMCFMLAIMLLVIFIATAIFAPHETDAWREAVINILILNWITMLALGGYFALRLR